MNQVRELGPKYVIDRALDGEAMRHALVGLEGEEVTAMGIGMQDQPCAQTGVGPANVGRLGCAVQDIAAAPASGYESADQPRRQSVQAKLDGFRRTGTLLVALF